MDKNQSNQQNQPLGPNEPKGQTPEYISKATSSKFKQNESKASSFIRNDIFLVRVKLPQAKWNIKNVENQEIKKFKEMFAKKQDEKRISKNKAIHDKIQDSQTNNLINTIKGFVKKQSNETIRGDFQISFLSSSSFYYSQEEYRWRCPKNLKPKVIQEQKNPIEKIISIGSSQTKQPPPQNAKTKSKGFKPNQSQKSKPNPVANMKKVKVSKISKYQMQKKVHHLQVNDPNKPDITYQQKYDFQYRRKFPKQKPGQTSTSQIEKWIKTSQKDKLKKAQLEFSQYPTKLLEDNQCLAFSATKKDVVQIKFKELLVGKIIKNLVGEGNNGKTKIKQNESQNKSMQEVYAVAWAKFPIKKFLQNPYISHQITLNLYREIQPNNKQKKDPIEPYLKSCQLSLQIFCAPGQSWGVLQFREIEIINWNLSPDPIRTQPRFVIIQIQFPDIQKLNLISLNQQTHCINFKSLEIEHKQKPIWVQEYHLNISSKHNRMTMRFVEMDGDSENQKEVLGQCNVDLIESGMVIDGVDGKRIFTLVKSIEGKKQIVGDLIVQFAFSINLKPKNSQDTRTFSKTNSFVDAAFNIT